MSEPKEVKKIDSSTLILGNTTHLFLKATCKFCGMYLDIDFIPSRQCHLLCLWDSMNKKIENLQAEAATLKERLNGKTSTSGLRLY